MKCTNTLGSYECRCPKGLRLSDDLKTCEDVNECLLRNGHGPCQDTCVNTFGHYNCSCAGLNGTKLAADGESCEDLDECAKYNAGCSHECINTLGRAFCSCPQGMELSHDWRTCQDIDECEDDVIKKTCENGCLNTIGSYHCLGMQNDQASVNIVCKPLFPPSRGFIRCSRNRAFQSFTRKGRKRIINSPGTVCELICPKKYKISRKYHVMCGLNGQWVGEKDGKCLERRYQL
ncbi:unnamed protein product [Phaedon cochleariae]|uniref:Uncharacterized protein n=1 Tax=Phaedon cochleariae TaxID=80249 RepID=A0A9P0GNH1_PHACE|nr:unnamed protein product [Phaedon cochleariae]